MGMMMMLLTNLCSSLSRDGGVLPTIPPSGKFCPFQIFSPPDGNNEEDSSVVQHKTLTKGSQNMSNSHVTSTK